MGTYVLAMVDGQRKLLMQGGFSHCSAQQGWPRVSKPCSPDSFPGG